MSVVTPPTLQQLALTEALALIRRFVAAHYPSAVAALLTGSQVRGEATADSDYDMVLLFDSLPGGAWREMVVFESRPIEVFAHDLSTLGYFCREIDRLSGVPVLPTMVAEGVSALPPSCVLDVARGIAQDILRLGPPELDAEELRVRRYAITDLAAALKNDRQKAMLIATGAALHAALADFALRAARNWSASGKAIPRALVASDAALAEQFDTAFMALFELGDVGPIQQLVDTVLRPYGGRLRDGFCQGAPAAWRDACRPLLSG